MTRTRTQATPEWVVSGTHEARLEAISEWTRLRLAEQERAAARIARDDAASAVDGMGNAVTTFGMTEDEDEAGSIALTERTVTRKTSAAMADHASDAMPISGVHILPTFGKGEHVAPYIGDRGAADIETVTPEYADAWAYVGTRTMGDGFMARVISVMISEATEHGRPVDHSKREDVASEARMRAADKLAELLTRDDVLLRVSDYPLGSVDTGARDEVGGVAEFLVPRERRCGACDGCRAARDRQSAGRASKWSLLGCESPVMAVDAITPNRVITRAIWQAAADPRQSTSAVYATRAPYLRKLATDVQNDVQVNVNGGDDALRYVPDGAAGLVRLMSAVLAITGDAVTVQGGLSPAARAILTSAMGTADTPNGAETALRRARALWPSEAGTRREAAHRARVERQVAATRARRAAAREAAQA